MDVEVPDEQAAEELVRELELRDLEAAKDVDRNLVHVAVESAEEGACLTIGPLVAIEAPGCTRITSTRTTVRLEGASHSVRARP